MTDPIESQVSRLQEAIEKAEEACPCRLGEYGICEINCNHDDSPFNESAGPPVNCVWPGHAAIRALAEVVREYGHYINCHCLWHTCMQSHAEAVYHAEGHWIIRDPRCLPREEDK